jgi:hypothetical protein
MVFSVQYVKYVQCTVHVNESHQVGRTEDAFAILNSLKILHFDCRDDEIVQQAFQQVLDFNKDFHLSYGLITDGIKAALIAAHRASNEYFTGTAVQRCSINSIIHANV